MKIKCIIIWKYYFIIKTMYHRIISHRKKNNEVEMFIDYYNFNSLFIIVHYWIHNEHNIKLIRLHKNIQKTQLTSITYYIFMITTN